MPILMVSANTREAQGHMADERFHNGYMAKPINLSALLGKIGELMNIHWQYAKAENISAEANAYHEITKIPVNNDQYKTLMALAEIGYLSGFKNKLRELSTQYRFPADVANKRIR
jgi:DNA-binding response OmpR family regulator